MLDVFLALLLLRALLISLHRRYLPAVVASAAALLLWAALAAAGWWGRDAERFGLSGAGMLAMLGPSTMPGATPAVPGSALLAAHPIPARAALAGLLVAGFAATWRHAARVSPLGDEADRRKALGLALLVPALLVAVHAACAGIAAALPTPY
jgi:hypothetical protein